MRLLSIVLVVQPCSSHVLSLEPPSTVQITFLFSVAILIALCYVFYPAYKSIEGSLSCNVVVLTGGNTLSLIIPAYNEEERLPVMMKATLDYLMSSRNMLSELFNKILGASKGGALKYELVVVDDGSKDNTIGVVKEYAKKVTGDTIKLVSMARNSGKGAAVMTGMLHSSGQLCLMIDADGATDITDGLVKVMKEMEVILQPLNNNSLPAAAVFGSRAHLEESSGATRSKVRTFLMHAFHFFVKNLCSAQIKDTQCGFKLFTRPAVVKLFSNLHLRRWAFDTEIVVIAEKLNIPLGEVAVVWHEVDGSKLDGSKLQLALVSLGMLRDMICVRACYFLNIWKLK
ncbi:hypothetical protein ACHAWO_009048 [Cyclotella atomus]|uniref:dolichyl-phosphate beta-glucosyltransferase n=1 Tax=Cyclotella atomus TaxID=382360 RepID=A0ABD3QZR7_9STRA